MTTAGIPVPTFTRFPDLPREVRLLIWELTYPTERTIQILPITFLSEWKWRFRLEGQHWTIDGTTPIALLVNHESRSHAKRTYKSLFSALGPLKEVSPPIAKVNFYGACGVRIDVNLDTILMAWGEMEHLMKYLDFGKIRHLALNDHEVHLRTTPHTMGMLNYAPLLAGPHGYASMWPNLKSLNFVLGRSTLFPARFLGQQWDTGFRFLDVDSNFDDMVDWLGKRVSKEVPKRKEMFKTLVNTASIAAELWMHYQIDKELLQQNMQWENLEFRVSVALYREKELPPDREGDWSVRFLNQASDLNGVPGLWREWHVSNSMHAPYLWVAYMRIGDENFEMVSRYDGIERLFRE